MNPEPWDYEDGGWTLDPKGEKERWGLKHGIEYTISMPLQKLMFPDSVEDVWKEGEVRKQR